MSQNYADQLETKNYIKNFCWCIVYTIEKKIKLFLDIIRRYPLTSCSVYEVSLINVD